MTGVGDWVAYVGPIRYPWGQACSRRVDGIARSLAAAGHRVVVASGEAAPLVPTPLADVDGPGSISHVGLGELPAAGTPVLRKAAHLLLAWGSRTVAWLDAQPRKPSHVIVYGGGLPYATRLRRWCRENSVPLIADIVEWYSPRQFTGGALDPFYLGAQLALRRHYPRCSGVIAISSHLQRYYRNSGCPVVRVPPTLDVQRVPAVDRPTDRPGLTLVYAGSPGRKDLLGTIVAAVDEVHRTGGAVRLRVLGPSSAQVRDLAGGTVSPAVEALGRLPQQQVARAVAEADFSVLLRPPARYAEAGFPTKFVESLAAGTPVIANATSDLRDHLHDGVEGVVCSGHSAAALVDSLRRALRLSADELATMRKAAREQALDSFDFRVHAGGLTRFLDQTRP